MQETCLVDSCIGVDKQVYTDDYTALLRISVQSVAFVALCGSVLHCLALCCLNPKPYRRPNTTHCSTLQHTTTHCNTLQHTAAHYNTLQHTATHCNTLQHTATHCNTLHHTATHCTTLLHRRTKHVCSKQLTLVKQRRCNGCWALAPMSRVVMRWGLSGTPTSNMSTWHVKCCNEVGVPERDW